MNKAFHPLSFPCGKTMKNRFALAPLTNQQSFEDGRLSEDEFVWLTMRAKGGFALTMTCASHVMVNGKGFPGQLGIYSDDLKEGHVRLAKAIKAEDSLAVVQLHHAGMRSPEALIGEKPLCPSNNKEYGARAINSDEVEELIKAFIDGAIRSKDWGYDGVEIHGAHGYILGQFLSREINLRTDKYGGSFENRSRILFEIVDGIRNACGNDFLVGVRLSPERFGMEVEETKQTCLNLVAGGKIDFLDISLWDWEKNPEDEKYAGKTLLKHFTDLDLGPVRLTVAGKIASAKDIDQVLSEKVDFVSIGKAGILHHDFPEKVEADPQFESIETPVSEAYLISEGLGDEFVKYMLKRPGFVVSD